MSGVLLGEILSGNNLRSRWIDHFLHGRAYRIGWRRGDRRQHSRSPKWRKFLLRLTRDHIIRRVLRVITVLSFGPVILVVLFGRVIYPEAFRTEAWAKFTELSDAIAASAGEDDPTDHVNEPRTGVLKASPMESSHSHQTDSSGAAESMSVTSAAMTAASLDPDLDLSRVSNLFFCFSLLQWLESFISSSILDIFRTPQGWAWSQVTKSDYDDEHGEYDQNERIWSLFHSLLFVSGLSAEMRLLWPKWRSVLLFCWLPRCRGYWTYGESSSLSFESSSCSNKQAISGKSDEKTCCDSLEMKAVDIIMFLMAMNITIRCDSSPDLLVDCRDIQTVPINDLYRFDAFVSRPSLVTWYFFIGW